MNLPVLTFGDSRLPDRFWAKVSPIPFPTYGLSGCWIWTGALTSKGYGSFNLGGNPQKTGVTHKLTLELVGGVIVQDSEVRTVVDHLCRLRACCNPDHLEAIPEFINVARGISPSAKNAQKVACPRGHAYTLENTALFKNKRYCKTCRKKKQMTPTFTSTSKNPKLNLQPGPWDTEPDRADFISSGMPCFVKRSVPAGAWCGYVGVPPSHTSFGKDYSTPNVNVHGGLTYAAKCNERSGICHVKTEGEPEPWWFGFDCAHPGDMVPDAYGFRSAVATQSFYGLGMSDDLPDSEGGTYRDLDFVVAQTVALAEQLAQEGEV